MLTRVWYDYLMSVDEAQPLIDRADRADVDDRWAITAFAHSQLCRGAIDRPPRPGADEDDDDAVCLPDDVTAYQCSPADLASIGLETRGGLVFVFVRDDLASVVSDGRIIELGAEYPITW